MSKKFAETLADIEKPPFFWYDNHRKGGFCRLSNLEK